MVCARGWLMLNWVRHSVVPVSTMLLAILAIWYAGAVYLNAPWALDQATRDETTLCWRWASFTAV